MVRKPPFVFLTVLIAVALGSAVLRLFASQPSGSSGASPQSEKPEATQSELAHESRRLVSSSTAAPNISQGALNWRTYKNDKHHYQIDYPLIAVLDEGDPAEVRISFKQQFDAGANQGVAGFSFTITVKPNPQNLSPMEWIRAAGPDDSVIRHRRDVILNGVRGYQITVFGYDQDLEQIYLAVKGQMYQLSYWSPDTMIDFTPAVRDQYKLLFERIVKSFRL